MVDLPLDLISEVQRCSNSATSSGSTLVRNHASDHCGFLLAVPLASGADCFLAASSLLLKTLEKKGMLPGRGRRLERVTEGLYYAIEDGDQLPNRKYFYVQSS